jgi:hypothetical protein
MIEIRLIPENSSSCNFGSFRAPILSNHQTYVGTAALGCPFERQLDAFSRHCHQSPPKEKGHRLSPMASIPFASYSNESPTPSPSTQSDCPPES